MLEIEVESYKQTRNQVRPLRIVPSFQPALHIHGSHLSSRLDWDSPSLGTTTSSPPTPPLATAPPPPHGRSAIHQRHNISSPQNNARARHLRLEPRHDDALHLSTTPTNTRNRSSPVLLPSKASSRIYPNHTPGSATRHSENMPTSSSRPTRSQRSTTIHSSNKSRVSSMH